MIQQPELGKKIADLRKAKGLTQEELVEKCNINVRTLQRIESGEAIPRTYTLKLIFEALDYSFDKSQDNKGLIKKWLEQFYISFIDLFNLKTKTMKKISILSIMLLGIAFGLFTFVLDGKAQVKNEKTNSVSEKYALNNQPDSEIKEGNFSCIRCFYDNDDLIGNGVKFKQEGVTGIFNLIKINTKTGEFNAGSIKGILLSNKAQVSVRKVDIDKRIVTYEADDSFEKTNKIVLKGNAKIVFSENEKIEADELIILLE